MANRVDVDLARPPYSGRQRYSDRPTTTLRQRNCGTQQIALTHIRTYSSGSVLTIGSPLELGGPADHFPVLLRVGPTKPPRATASTRKEPTGSTPKLAHVRQPRTTVVNPACSSSHDRNAVNRTSSRSIVRRSGSMCRVIVPVVAADWSRVGVCCSDLPASRPKRSRLDGTRSSRTNPSRSRLCPQTESNFLNGSQVADGFVVFYL